MFWPPVCNVGLRYYVFNLTIVFYTPVSVFYVIRSQNQPQKSVGTTSLISTFNVSAQVSQTYISIGLGSIVSWISFPRTRNLLSGYFIYHSSHRLPKFTNLIDFMDGTLDVFTDLVYSIASSILTGTTLRFMYSTNVNRVTLSATRFYLYVTHI